MSDAITAHIGAPNGSGAPEGSNGAPPPAPIQGKPDLTSDQLAARLREERDKGRNSLLKDLGFEKPDDVKAFVDAAKKRAEAELSETEKLKKAADDLKPRAERAALLEQRRAAVAKSQLEALPEALRNTISKRAGDDPEKVLDLIEMFRDAGQIGAAAPPPGPPPAPAPANSATPNNAPKPGVVNTKFDEWQSLVAAGKQTPADIFYRLNQAEIERTRPAGR